MNKRLVGSDGKLVVGTFGTDVVDAGTLDADVWYLVKGIDGTSSVFPAGAIVGFLYKAVGTEVLAADDIAAPWEGTDLCDVQSWSLDFSKSESDVTAFCDKIRVYRSGKVDITGGIEGVFTTGITSKAGGLQNQFVTIVKQNNGETAPDDYVISLAEGATIMAQLYADETETANEIEAFYWVPMTLTGFSAAAGGEDAQTFSSPFRVSPTDSGEFAFYEYTNE